MRRPRSSDPEIQAAAVEALLPEVMRWLASGNSEISEAEVRVDLLDCLDVDGYHFAKGLEERSIWAVDSGLVEVLDAASGRLFHALHQAERAWVAANKLAPSLGIGGRCRFKYGILDEDEYDGSVIGIEDTGHYRIFSQALGHVPSGKIGTQAVIIPWENVMPILPEDPA